MKFRHCRVWLGLALMLAVAGHSAAAEGEDPGQQAAALMASHTTNIMRMRPVNATRLGLMDEDVGARINDAMDDYSTTNMQQWRRTVQVMQSELARLPDSAIDPLMRAALQEIYRAYLGAPLPFGFIDQRGRHRPYIINQIDQPLQEVPKAMTSFQRVDSAEDVADYLRRMWALTSLVDSVLSKFNSDADAGWLPPRPVLQGALDYLETFVATPPAEHPLVVNLLEKADAGNVLTVDERARVENEAVTVMVRVVYPAYRNAIKNVTQRLPEASQAAGIWARPAGDRFYAAAVKNEARTDLSPGQIHDLGLGEVERISAEMDAILDAQGYRDGNVGERMRKLGSESRFRFDDTTEGQAALLARIEATGADMQARLPGYFGTLPAEGFVVQPVPEERQAGASLGRYDGPPADGGAPGIFWINLRSLGELAWFDMPTLTYHETVPGHHLQMALARRSAGRPMLWRFADNSAYSEGWALYAERLAAEMGVYEDDPFGDLGRLRDELRRAVRLVVDTGLHHKRWTREQAETYMLDTLGLGETEIRAEVLRYMAWPGQALAYKMGMLAILEMREDARRELGDAFDISEFHDTVLGTGPVSMPLLRQQVESWAQR